MIHPTKWSRSPSEMSLETVTYQLIYHVTPVNKMKAYSAASLKQYLTFAQRICKLA